MSMRVAINGFGRIGRLLFRAAIERKADINFVAVNDLTKASTLAHLLKYDSVHRTLDADIEATENSIIVNGKEIEVISQPDPAQLPWKEKDVFLVVESTGRFRDREGASKHLQAGAKKVLISAPAKEPDVTIVLGVNDKIYDNDKHNLISNASCTTNCISPVTKVLNDNFGIELGLMTTTHAYTNDQRLLDLQHKDLRRSRAAPLSIVPTTTGAAIATTIILPELQGKLNGMAFRVPVPNVSVVDLVANLKERVTKDDVNEAFKKAAKEELKGILDYTDKPLVSSDYMHNPYSAIVDGLSTMVIGGKMVKVVAWYDNEWGFSNRMVEMIKLIGEKAGF